MVKKKVNVPFSETFSEILTYPIFEQTKLHLCQCFFSKIFILFLAWQLMMNKRVRLFHERDSSVAAATRNL